MSDYIVRATAANSQIRAFAAVTTDMVETARKDHNTSRWQQRHWDVSLPAVP
jgi:Disulfide bond chaperones of the HSP33 family